MTEDTPELSVTAITFRPLLVPFDNDPALVAKKTLAQPDFPPDCPGLSVTERLSFVPTAPV